MRIILLEDVKNLGKKGELREASDGFARNFLFPKNLAIPATDEAIKMLAKEEEAGRARRKAAEQRYRDITEILAKTPITIKTKMGERGKAFGAVSASKIRAALADKKIDIRKEWLELAEPIKTTGEHTLRITFPGGIEAMLRLNVLPEK